MSSLIQRLSAVAVLGVSFAAFAGDFALTSPEIKDGQRLSDAQVANAFGCTGGNKAPALEWRGAPKDAKSFAVTVYDPDAPTGSGWWHWVVFDIPATAKGLSAGVTGPTLPAGARQGRGDAGNRDFFGACPPPGDKPHRYVFTVHALKTPKLEVPEDASAALIGFMIHANQIDKASVTAKYSR